MSEREAEYRKNLIRAKARLYYLLTLLPENELTDDSPELDMMYALSRDRTMQEILSNAISGNNPVREEPHE